LAGNYLTGYADDDMSGVTALAEALKVNKALTSI
jgi:hypothetical protein